MSWEKFDTSYLIENNYQDQKQDQDDKPRYLTKKEIQYIIDRIPYTLAADSHSRELLHTQIQEYYRKILSEEMICPSGIPELVSELQRYFTDSMVLPGQSAGLNSAESLGATVTQITLNTFHSSGTSKSVTKGIDQLKNIIHARKNPKDERCIIHYTDKLLSFEKVLRTRELIIGLYVNEVISDYMIGKHSNFEMFWWSGLFKKLPKSEVRMRIILNIDNMYRHRVTIEDVCIAIENESPGTLVCDYGTFQDGIIDIFPTEKMILDIIPEKKLQIAGRELYEITFFESIVYPSFDKIRIKGIGDLKNLTPSVTKILDERYISYSKIDQSTLKSKRLSKFESLYGDLYFFKI